MNEFSRSPVDALSEAKLSLVVDEAESVLGDGQTRGNRGFSVLIM